MTQLIRDLVALLSKEVALGDITARLGPVARDPGIPMPAELTPSDPAVRRVEVGRYPDNGKPYTVELELTVPVSVGARCPCSARIAKGARIAECRARSCFRLRAPGRGRSWSWPSYRRAHRRSASG
jgi:hypothetical protein